MEHAAVVETMQARPMGRFGTWALQLGGTLLILLSVPNTVCAAVLLLGWWGLTFERLRRAELVFFACTNLFFFCMNAAALKNGVFAFAQGDVLGIPCWELFMWGFYVVHALRTVGGPVPRRFDARAWAVAAGFVAAFAVVRDQQVLFAVTTALLTAGLLLFHQKHDLLFVAYLVGLGALIEYGGVIRGLWHYPDAPAGGVPPWFVGMWGGVGLLLRRLCLPLLNAPAQCMQPHMDKGDVIPSISFVRAASSGSEAWRQKGNLETHP
ncbi:MAG: hypothetical protein L6R28_09785 [Planctomycetes bacterium]|nr:hypothetical protein [Planctomycetota bacterium]